MSFEGQPTLTGGLSNAEARKRLRVHGPNQLQPEKTSALRLWLGQFSGPLNWLLIAAALVSQALGQSDDALMIAALLCLNALLGFGFELHAERELSAMHKRIAPRARVRRDGDEQEISSLAVVAGDILLLAPGSVVAADARLLEAKGLYVREHELTGETRPVLKQAPDPGAEPSAARERSARVFSGTLVEAGSGVAEVVATGEDTELARLGKRDEAGASAPPATTLLEQQLKDVTRVLMRVCVSIVALVAISDLIRGRPWSDVFLTGVALAVAALPEGLPTMVTLGLARGVRYMAKRHIFVRRLDAIESVGSTTVICSGKSGVLTTGRLEVRAYWGMLEADPLLQAAVRGVTQAPEVSEDSIAFERAILEAAQRRGFLHDAPARVEAASSGWLLDDAFYRTDNLDALQARGFRVSEGVRSAAEAMREQGHRRLGVVTWQAGQPAADGCFVGLLGVSEPPRPGTREALARARRAGVRIVMVTGDEPRTAVPIARELGVLGPEDTPDEVVLSQATPQRKLELVQRLRQRGEVVAMTGESANNVPALREADVAFSVRQSSEVTRAASDMIVLDDDFAHVVSAIKCGRGIYTNIRRALVYLMVGNVAELAVMLIASVLGMPTPLLPVQLLWVNMITDGPPALALVFAPIDDEVMARPPRGRNARMLGRKQWNTIAAVGALQAVVCLGIYVWSLHARGLGPARNLLFSSLVFVEVLWAFAAQDEQRSFWQRGLRANLGLILVALPAVALQLVLPYLPFGHILLGHETSELQVGVPLLIGCATTLLVELVKRAVAKRSRQRQARAQ